MRRGVGVCMYPSLARLLLHAVTDMLNVVVVEQTLMMSVQEERALGQRQGQWDLLLSNDKRISPTGPEWGDIKYIT